MDEEDMDKTVAVLETALDELCLDTEPRPSKRLRTGEAKSLQHCTPSNQSKNIEQAVASKVPSYLTWSEWSSLVPGTTVIPAKDLVERLAITPQNLKDYEPLIKLNLEERNGRFYMKGNAPRTSRVAALLSKDEIKALIPPGGLWLSELLQKSAIRNDDFPALMTAIRQVAVLKNAKIYLRDDPAINFEQQVDDSELFYTTVVYNSDDLSTIQLKLEHANMQQCIDQLRETIRDERKARAGLYKRFGRYKLEQYAEIARMKREVYAGTLVENSTIRIRVVLLRSTPEDEIAMDTSAGIKGNDDEIEAADDEEGCMHASEDGEGDQSDQGQCGGNLAEEEDGDNVDDNDENDDEDDEANGIEDEETTIFVNSDLASTLTKLRRGLVPFLNPDFVDAIWEAERRGKENVQALLLEGDCSDDGIPLTDISSDESKKMYAEWYARNATHSENDAGGVEIYVYT